MANHLALEQGIQIQLGSNKAIIIIKTILGDYYKKMTKFIFNWCFLKMTFFGSIIQKPISSIIFIREKQVWYQIKEEGLLITYCFNFWNRIYTMSSDRMTEVKFHKHKQKNQRDKEKERDRQTDRQKEEHGHTERKTDKERVYLLND